MIKIENIEVFGWHAAIRGMRNPLNSWHLSDSEFDMDGVFCVGPKDLDLMLRLAKAGTDHRKYTRMLHVQMDITAPLYWWKDYDTYKVGTVANSCSTMHKIHDKEFTEEMFAVDDMGPRGRTLLALTIESLNGHRRQFLDSNKTDKKAWEMMIKMLPCSYLQKRTVDLNYEVLLSLVNARKAHKLTEFRELCTIVRNELPYFEEIFNACHGGRN